VVGGVEYGGMALFPTPPELDFSTPEAARASVAQVPAGAVAAVGAAWGVGALVGGFTAARITRREWAAWIVAALLLAGALYNLIAIPSPIWPWVGGPAAIVIGAWVGARLGAPKPA
jgi:hypothetical protein